ncbi:MAG: hypothetical protein IKN57_08340, partial [Parasporobacterium sp.]|nr:hypothetical protein [Parasporobacterium sp.]
MKKLFKKLVETVPKRATMTHASLLAIIGGYFIYMGIMMIRNTRSKASSMSMEMSTVLCAVMCIIGLAVISYGGLIFYHARNHSGLQDSDINETAEEGTQNDPEQENNETEEEGLQHDAVHENNETEEEGLQHD